MGIKTKLITMTPQEFLESKGLSRFSFVKDPEGNYDSIVNLLSGYADCVLSLAAEKAIIQKVYNKGGIEYVDSIYKDDFSATVNKSSILNCLKNE